MSLDVLREVVEVDDATLSVDDVRGADEVWVVSATRPLLPVHALDDVAYEAPGPVASEVRDRLDAHIAETLD